MAHDSTKVVMGSPGISGYNVVDFVGDPATYLAGLACRLKSDDTVSVTKADGSWIGVSLGKSLSSTKRLSILTDGNLVPMLVERQPARGTVEILAYANLVSGTDETITVGATVFTSQTGAVTLGQTTFRAATSNEATATSLAAQINAHATAGALVKATASEAVVTLTAISNTTSGDSIALSYEAIGAGSGASVSGATLTDSDDTPDYIVIGEKAYISDSTGKVDDPNSGSTISDATFASGLLSGIDETGAAVLAVLVNMPGGL